jgi:hypothetical protein
MITQPDFSGEIKTEAAPNVLATLAQWVQRIRLQQQVVNTVTAELERATAELNRLILVQVPEAMEEAGLTEFKLADGAVLTVKDDLKVSIPLIHQEAAYAWLTANGHGLSIQQTLTVDLRMLEQAERDSLLAVTREEFNVEPVVEQSIHNATLKSLVKETLERGITLPPCFSIYQFKKAGVKETKASKK